MLGTGIFKLIGEYWFKNKKTAFKSLVFLSLFTLVMVNTYGLMVASEYYSQLANLSVFKDVAYINLISLIIATVTWIIALLVIPVVFMIKDSLKK